MASSSISSSRTARHEEAPLAGQNASVLAELERLETALGLRLGPELKDCLSAPAPDALRQRVYRAGEGSSDRNLHWAVTMMRLLSAQPVDRDLVPVAAVDDRSYACVVCEQANDAPKPDLGAVVRWHLDEVPRRAQRQLLDVDLLAYFETLEREEHTREEGFAQLKRLAVKYYASHDNGTKLPRSHECRPIRLACQNVIIGHAGFYFDARFNGLAVCAWQTCEAPHVAAHEGDRALAALTLAEAFRTGGTMEIRFDEHPERAVPARLRQFARTRGITLGASDARAITPAEARQLLQAVTPMPADLAARVRAVTNRGEQSVERACYVLLSGIWKPIELDFLLATSSRSLTILQGGSDVLNRGARQAETAIARAAAMAGTVFARLSLAPEQPREAESIEDQRLGVEWRIIGDAGALVFTGVAAGRLPWQRGSTVELRDGQPLLVLVRPLLGPGDRELAAEVARAEGAVAATLEAPDAQVVHLGSDIAQLIYPDRLQTLDRQIERRLLSCRVGRS
jgi:hypothetical protein